MKIVFFGTAEFAVASLDAVHGAGYEVAAVVTAPDKPAGRGLQLKDSPVKEAALRLGLPLLQPEKLKNEAFLEELRALQAAVQVVVAFRMLPEVVWNMPPLGTINVHGSLLPNYRGAAPIHWAVANGETVTGVTTFFLRHEIDTGDLILQEEEPIGPDDTTGQVYERLMARGARLLVKTLDAVKAGCAPRLPQAASADLKHAPKITSENSRLRFDQPAGRARDFVRGMAPFPTAWAVLQGRQVKVHQARLPAEPLPEWAGEVGILVSAQGRLLVSCADGWLEITRLQPEGKKVMTGKDYLNGMANG